MHTKPVNFTIHPTDEYPLGNALFALIPDDGCNGYMIGDMAEVINLRDALNCIIEDPTAHGGVISRQDERLGWRWLTVTEAAEQFNVPLSTVRYAAANGYIEAAVKLHGRWRFPQAFFLGWLHHRPKRGPKPR